jgi:hypothetical protein
VGFKIIARCEEYDSNDKKNVDQYVLFSLFKRNKREIQFLPTVVHKTQFKAQLLSCQIHVTSRGFHFEQTRRLILGPTQFSLSYQNAILFALDLAGREQIILAE